MQRRDAVFRINPNVVWRRETKGGRENGFLLFNYETQRVHFITGIAKEIWKLCAEKESISMQEIAESLGIKNDEKNELVKTLKEFEKRKLIIFEHVN